MTPDKRPASADLCQYVTIQQAASALHVDPKTIRRRIADGTLPAFRVGIRRPGTLRDTRSIRIPADALAAILSPVATPALAAREGFFAAARENVFDDENRKMAKGLINMFSVGGRGVAEVPETASPMGLNPRSPAS